MSRHSEGQHNRKLYKIVSKPDRRPSQVGSGEEPSLSNGWQSEQVKQTNSRYQIRATNGTKPAKEIRGGEQKINSHTNGKQSSFLDQHLYEKSTDRGNSTHEILGHNIERLKEVVKRRLLRPSKARKSANTRLRLSSSANDLSSYTLISGLADGSNPGRQCHAYETEETCDKSHDCCVVNQTDHLIEELEDTREQLKRSLEDNARLQTEVNHLADELYRFKIVQMTEQNGAAMTLGTESSADASGLVFMVQGTGRSKNQVSESDLKDGKAYYEHHEISIVRSREALESQLKILEDQINKLEQHMEVHKFEGQATVAQPSEFYTNVMKNLCEMTSLQKAIKETSKDCFAKTQMALKSKSVENDQLRRVVLEYKTEMDTLVQQVNATMEEEWSELQEKQDQLEVERERLSQKPIMELKTQIIQLRCGYEQKITRLQEETKKLEEDNAALEHRYTDLREKFAVKQEQATAEQLNGDNMEHTLETRSSINQEGRTTHLERVVNELQLDMQMMVANNEKLCMKVQQSLQSCASPPTAQKRSPSPSPVAVINYKPMSQSENSKPQSLQQVNVEPILKNVSPTLPYSANNCNEQQQINFMEGAKVKEDAQVIDNPQTMKHNIKLDDKSTIDDRPFDPNLVCLRCRKQFRIGEIQEYRKHYEDCQIKQNGQPIQMDPVIPVEHTVIIEPKLLCRTPGCSFKGYKYLGGLCPDCYYGQAN